LAEHNIISVGNEVRAILKDDHGRLWLGTKLGNSMFIKMGKG